MDASTTYFIIASASAFGGALLKLLYDSKCSHLNICFGCVELERDIKSEVECEEHKTHERRPSNHTDSLGENNI
jgi:hypothetical protein